MGFFNRFLGNETTTELKEVSIPQVSLIDKLKEIGFDLSTYNNQGGELSEISFEMETLGIVKETYKELENDFFNNYVYIDKKGNTYELDLFKDGTTERDFKEFINKLYGLFGDDLKQRGEFDILDLTFIRGNSVNILRVWEDKVSGYFIRVYMSEQKGLWFQISNSN